MGAEQSVSAPRRNQLAVSAVFHGPEGGSILSRMPEGIIMTSQLHHIVGGSLCACATAGDESLAKD